VVALVAALLVGFVQSLLYRRNMLPASTQMTAYLSGFLVAWAIFGATNAGVLVALADSGWLTRLRDASGLVLGGQFILLFVVPNAAWGAIYLVLVARGSAAARYANR
jgi:hypothetical protein